MRRLRHEMRREMRRLHREMRRLRREMRQLRPEMRRLHCEMRRLHREMHQLRHECVDCVVVKCDDYVWTSCTFSVTSDLTHCPNIDLWPYRIFIIMWIRPRLSLIFITPHEYSAPPLINIHHPWWIFSATTLLRDVTSLKGCSIRGGAEYSSGWWILMRGGAEYSWGVMNINEGRGLFA